MSRDPGAGDPRPRDVRARDLVAVGLWLLVALGWVLATVLPWYTQGILRATSLLEVGQVVRSGALPVPTIAGYGVLVLPLLAAVLVAVAAGRGVTALLVRMVALLAGSAAVITLLVLLADVGAGSWGVGLWAGVLACGVGVVALCLSTVRTGTEVRASPQGVLAGPLVGATGPYRPPAPRAYPPSGPSWGSSAPPSGPPVPLPPPPAYRPSGPPPPPPAPPLPPRA
ncbi:hypothetical protein RDV89_10450 [Nocardioides zeae]|uniref:Uncharacterized protein n=1 Tax=Nocardioides imazamoxiresistens TaxID=3231893 RepID=A0ABU3PXE6_9ACTN|nr:hypothetical protein [Nocardioides zeae]MDT9593487.1 hypothetical protein [Nocardioides zeae]